MKCQKGQVQNLKKVMSVTCVLSVANEKGRTHAINAQKRKAALVEEKKEEKNQLVATTTVRGIVLLVKPPICSDNIEYHRLHWRT
jgi:hypothetical protein